MFVNAVMSGSADFAMAYVLLQQSCCEEYRSASSSPVFGARTPPLTMDDRISPFATYKLTPSEIAVEPLKLSGVPGSKRMRSMTLVEPPTDLSSVEGYESELAFSRSNSPAPPPAVSISPRKPYRTCRMAASPVSSFERDIAKSPRQVKNGLGGERRLNINFLNTGKLDGPIQTFGKYRLLIRDGLCGTHTMYAQPWRFEINYLDGCQAGDAGEVRLRWSVTNLLSGRTITYAETAEQAKERQVKGNTICNLVVREALNKRAEELEEEMNDLGGASTRTANLRSLVKELRPKQCTEGLLFFGLRHQIAQRKTLD
jgi:hypothetical protein